jgi:hypothetical protein
MENTKMPAEEIEFTVKFKVQIEDPADKELWIDKDGNASISTIADLGDILREADVTNVIELNGYTREQVQAALSAELPT